MTVPYGGDVANPMGGDSGPGKAGYVIGTLLIVAGFIGGFAWFGMKYTEVESAVDDFERVPVDEVRTIDLEPGDYVVYGEKGGGDAIGATLGEVRIRPEGEEGGELTVEDYEAEFTYDVDRPLRAEYTFEVEDGGEYQVRAEGISGAATTAAFGPSIAGDFVSGLVGGLIIGGGLTLLGTILLIVTGVRRRRWRQRGWQAGWGGGQPGAWAPGGGQGFGQPPAPGGAWNPPPPPGGGYPPPPSGTF
jgi:hypothetical protein